MPDIHQNTLRAIIEHLGKVAAKAEINKMTAKNLAVVFGKALFGEDELPKDGDLSSYSFGKVSLVICCGYLGYRRLNSREFTGYRSGRFHHFCRSFIRRRILLSPGSSSCRSSTQSCRKFILPTLDERYRFRSNQDQAAIILLLIVRSRWRRTYIGSIQSESCTPCTAGITS